jgi:microcystin-dependent protein
MPTVTPGYTFTSNEVVTPAKLTAAATPTVSNIVTADIVDANVTTAKIANAAVTNAKLASEAVTNAKLASDIDASKITTGTLPIARIAGGSVTLEKLVLSVQQALLPAGAVQAFAMNGAPSGWLAANGSNVSRTTYAALFSAIGTTYGTGDGSTTFTLPDLRGYFVRGSGTNSDGVAAGTFGQKQTDAYKSHNHGGVTGTGTTGTESQGHTHSGTTGSESADHAHYVSGTTSSNGSHTHTQSGGGGSDDGGPYVTGSQSSGTLNNIAANGAHTHNFAEWTGGRNTAHTHSFTTGGVSANHTHSVPALSISSDGTTETRPRNIAMLYCIKF